MRRPSTHFGAALLASLLLAFAAAPECRADLLSVDDGGIDDAVGCTTADCIGTQTFGLAAAAPVSGTVEIDPIGLTIDFDLDVIAVSLLETVAGTEDNGVAEVEFTDVNYFAAGLPITEGIPNSFSIDFDSKALIEGDQTQWNDADVAVNGTPALFTRTEVLVTGNCFLPDPSNATCSFSFGTPGFALDVGDPSPATRHFRHTMSLVLLPEPKGLTMLASGVLALLLLGRGRMAR
jgi:hypothetical protein